MCEFCKMDIDVFNREETCNKTICEIVNGNQIFGAQIQRTRIKDESYYYNELFFDYNVSLGEGETPYQIKSCVIPIKYCPFCGEKF